MAFIDDVEDVRKSPLMRAFQCMCFASGASILGVLYSYIYHTNICSSQLLYELNYDIVNGMLYAINDYVTAKIGSQIFGAIIYFSD